MVSVIDDPRVAHDEQPYRLDQRCGGGACLWHLEEEDHKFGGKDSDVGVVEHRLDDGLGQLVGSLLEVVVFQRPAGDGYYLIRDGFAHFGVGRCGGEGGIGEVRPSVAVALEAIRTICV